MHIVAAMLATVATVHIATILATGKNAHKATVRIVGNGISMRCGGTQYHSTAL